MTTLPEFITARLDDDEAAARAVADRPWRWSDPLTYPQRIAGVEEAAHIARHSPARVLREVAAKRAILTAWQEALRNQAGFKEVSSETANREALEFGCRHVAAAWSDHPDYQQEWKP